MKKFGLLFLALLTPAAFAQEANWRNDGETIRVRPGKPGGHGRQDRRDWRRPQQPNRPYPIPNQPAPIYPIPQPQPQYGYTQTIPVRQVFQGHSRLYLGQFIQLAAYQGLRLQSITLVTATRQGQGDATFCGASGCNTIWNVSTMMFPHRFQGWGAWINGSSNQWFFDLRGNFYVDSIQLEFSR